MSEPKLAKGVVGGKHICVAPETVRLIYPETRRNLFSSREICMINIEDRDGDVTEIIVPDFKGMDAFVDAVVEASGSKGVDVQG